MTTALVIGPDAGIGERLRELGLAVEVVAADPHALAGHIRGGDGDVILTAGDTTVDGHVLARFVEDRRLVDARLAGVLKVAAAQRARLADAAERVTAEGEPLARIADALALRTVDAARIRLDAAVKPVDGFFTTFFVSPYSRYVARWAARRGLTPDQVTIASLAIGLLCAAAFATGARWGLIAGAVLLQVAFTADCVDGQLARYTRNFSQLGGWLDATFDRAKEWLVYAGLAIGSGDVWVLAAAALTLQTFRHMVDFCWQERRGSSSAELGRWDASPGAVTWVKRIIAFPIGERFAAISITAAIWSAQTTFVVLLAWGGFAALYATTGRIVRSRRLARRAAPGVARYRDDGPLARALLARAQGWMLPPLLRALEYGGLLTFGTLAGASSEPAAFALLATLALRQYDIVYGLRFRGVPVSERLGVALGGWDGRLALGCALLILNLLPGGYYALAAIIAVVTAVTAVRDWHDKEDVNR